jgi:uncharacterized protein
LHDVATEVMESESLIISPFVLTELDHLVHRRAGFDVAMRAAEALIARMEEGQYKLARLEVADLSATHDVRDKYYDLKLDFADAVGVVLADRYKTDSIFTLDERDFRAITPLTKNFSAFRILPADL